MTNFFTRSKELKEKATEEPWEILISKTLNTIAISHKSPMSIPFVVLQKDQIKDTRKDNAEYIVHCVNTHAKLCELLERALKQLDGADSYNQMCKREIQAELEKL